VSDVISVSAGGPVGPDRGLDPAQYHHLPAEWRERVDAWIRRHGFEPIDVHRYDEIKPGLFRIVGYEQPPHLDEHGYPAKWHVEVIDECPAPTWMDYVNHGWIQALQHANQDQK
jgi:hypothetical protein